MSTAIAPSKQESLGTGRIVRGETQYDRTVSGLIAAILGVACVVGWLFIQYMAMQAFNRPMSAPLEIIEVSGGGGGTLEGTVGESETIEVLEQLMEQPLPTTNQTHRSSKKPVFR